jgi:hypothetical protein
VHHYGSGKHAPQFALKAAADEKASQYEQEIARDSKHKMWKKLARPCERIPLIEQDHRIDGR